MAQVGLITLLTIRGKIVMNTNLIFKNILLILSAVFFSHGIFCLNYNDYQNHSYFSNSILNQFLNENNENKNKKIIIDFINFFINEEENEINKKNKEEYNEEISTECIKEYFALKKDLYISLFSSSHPFVNEKTILSILREEMTEMFLNNQNFKNMLKRPLPPPERERLVLIASYRHHFSNMDSIINEIYEIKATAIHTNNVLRARIIACVNALLIGQNFVRASALDFDFPKNQNIYDNKVATKLIDSNVLFDLKLSNLFMANEKVLNIVLLGNQNNGLTKQYMLVEDFATQVKEPSNTLSLGKIASKYIHNLIHFFLKENKKRVGIKRAIANKEIEEQILLKKEIESDKYFKELMQSENKKGGNANKKKNGNKNKKKNTAPQRPPFKLTPAEKKIKELKEALEQLKEPNREQKPKPNAGKKQTGSKKNPKQNPKNPQKGLQKAQQNQRQRQKKEAGQPPVLEVAMIEDKAQPIEVELSIDEQSSQKKQVSEEQRPSDEAEISFPSKNPKNDFEKNSYILVTKEDGSESLEDLNEIASQEIARHLFQSPKDISEHEIERVKCSASSLAGAILAKIDVLGNHYNFSFIARTNDEDGSFIQPILNAQARTMEIIEIIPHIITLHHAINTHQQLEEIATIINGYIGNLHNMIIQMENFIVVPLALPPPDSHDQDSQGFYDEKGTWHPYH